MRVSRHKLNMNEEINKTNLSQATTGYGIAASIAIIFNTLLTFLKEEVPAVNAAMKAALGHHWITHSVLVVLVFLILGAWFSRSNYFRDLGGKTLSIFIVGATILGGLGLVIWFIFI